MGAKKSKKGRKFGRQKRRHSGQSQAMRTEANKVRTLNRERKKAGLPEVDQYTARALMDKSQIKS
jgi:hypothetical protein